jgi:hypothetical protein
MTSGWHGRWDWKKRVLALLLALVLMFAFQFTPFKVLRVGGAIIVACLYLSLLWWQGGMSPRRRRLRRPGDRSNP